MTDINKLKRFFRKKKGWVLSILFLAGVVAHPDVTLLAKAMITALFIYLMCHTFGCGNNKKSKQSNHKDEVNSGVNEFYTNVMQEYGRYIEINGMEPMCVSDQENLPYPKDLIKKSLQLGLLTTTDDSHKSALKATYAILADYQAGVGNTDICFMKFPTIKPGSDLEKIADNPDLLDSLKKAEEAHEEYRVNWQDKIEKEYFRLLSERDDVYSTISANYSDFSMDKYLLNLKLYKRHYERFNITPAVLTGKGSQSLEVSVICERSLDCENKQIEKFLESEEPCLIVSTY